MNQPVRAAIIGAGNRSRAFTEFIAANPDRCRLVAIFDLHRKKSQVLRDYSKLSAQIYDDYDALLARKDIDAVIIATPDYAHVAPVVSALKTGKHIYLEKPLATTIEDCNTIIAAAAGSKSICYLGFNMRHCPIHEKIYELINAGRLGKLTTIEANEYYYAGKSYFRRWHRLRKFGGGLWLTKACHDFDLLTWLSGGHPKSLYAMSSLSHYKPIPGAGPRCRDCAIKRTCPDFYDIFKPLDGWLEEQRKVHLFMEKQGETSSDICLFNSDKDTFDNGIVVIEYDNDVRATYTVNVVAARNTRQIRIVGTDGMVEGDTEHGLIQYTQRHTGKITTYDLRKEVEGTHEGADPKIFSDFFNICLNGGTPRSGLEDGRLAVKLALAATTSCDMGAIIKF